MCSVTWAVPGTWEGHKRSANILAHFSSVKFFLSTYYVPHTMYKSFHLIRITILWDFSCLFEVEKTKAQSFEKVEELPSQLRLCGSVLSVLLFHKTTGISRDTGQWIRKGVNFWLGFILHWGDLCLTPFSTYHLKKGSFPFRESKKINCSWRKERKMQLSKRGSPSTHQSKQHPSICGVLVFSPLLGSGGKLCLWARVFRKPEDPQKCRKVGWPQKTWTHQMCEPR